MNDPGNERKLLRACRRGDGTAARCLHARMFPILAVAANRVLGDRSLAEDAAQNALLRMLRTPTFRVDLVRNPRAWLLTLVIREALMLRRSARRSAYRDSRRAIPKRAEVETPEHDQLADAVESLEGPLREIVLLKHGAGLSFDEMGKTLGVNRDTLASRNRRALVLLRTALVEHEADEKEKSDAR